MTKKHITFWMGVHRWKIICGAVIATAAALTATVGPAWRWASHKDKVEAQQAQQIDNNTQAITAITSKLDKVAEDTSEIRGSVDTLLRLIQAGGRDHQAVRVTSNQPPASPAE